MSLHVTIFDTLDTSKYDSGKFACCVVSQWVCMSQYLTLVAHKSMIVGNLLVVLSQWVCKLAWCNICHSFHKEVWQCGNLDRPVCKLVSDWLIATCLCCLSVLFYSYVLQLCIPYVNPFLPEAQNHQTTLVIYLFRNFQREFSYQSLVIFSN